ncbi:MAG: HAMP domain-containing histidine kinase [Desulfobacterium sp.]|nr:HAMP domain-containing histidine kinase [Desulfobacterium sp.]MBU3949447.1 HAMP domain-containing histidine kinase [Pseudomonadota bacterium]MBU4009478.1 HAMP domain-containing histidine kinase [Pseudomonadota bacterium]MBU4035938.1 HAMP domain-containing histidine kinase [Pseudomonadota bacterium]
MDQSKWFYPIIVFMLSVMALATSLFLYIYWYIRVSSGLKTIVTRFNIEPSVALESHTWVVILVLSVLVGIILLGIFTIFMYNLKTYQLYRIQQNFINNFTHELKTPVTSLKLFLETLSKHELSRPEQIKYINYMIQDVVRLSDNIGRILDLAGIESKSYQGDFIETDLVAAVESFCKTNSHLFPECIITVHNLSNNPYVYPINTYLFEMLLMNLLTNAVKYNDSKVPTIDISFDLQNNILHLKFEDNGIGIEKNQIKKIFGKFYQVGQYKDMTAKGSGLGLYLVQNIAHTHNGKVVAESNGIGKGSVFTLKLPYKE